MVYTPRSVLRRILPTNRTYQMLYMNKTIRNMLESKGSLWSKFVAFIFYVIAEMLFVALLAWFFFVVLWFLKDKG